MSQTKAPRDDDRLLGQRIRQARLRADLSQSELGNAIGVTFQQLQKYELGVNRVSVSRFQQIADALDLPISALLPDTRSALPHEGLLDKRYSRDALLVLDAFDTIKDRPTRKKILALIAALTKAEI